MGTPIVTAFFVQRLVYRDLFGDSDTAVVALHGVFETNIGDHGVGRITVCPSLHRGRLMMPGRPHHHRMVYPNSHSPLISVDNFLVILPGDSHGTPRKYLRFRAAARDRMN